MDFQIPKDKSAGDFDAENDDPVGLNFNVKNPGLVCKITCINQYGEIVLDSLVDYNEKPIIKAYERKPKNVVDNTDKKKSVKFEGHQGNSTDSTNKTSSSDDEKNFNLLGKKRSH